MISHGRSDRIAFYSATVASAPTDLTITGIDEVILEVHYQDFIIDPEDIQARGVGSSALKGRCTGCSDGSVDSGEECDDSNLIDGGGCDSSCQV